MNRRMLLHYVVILGLLGACADTGGEAATSVEEQLLGASGDRRQAGDGHSDEHQRGDAGAPAGRRISKPGVYEGYSPRIYQGYELSSRYVQVRDGTQLAVDLYRPKDAGGKVVDKPLPVLWMHSPYNRRYFQATPTTPMGLSGERYPGAAARLVEYGYVVAIVDFRGLYASYGRNVGFNRGEWVEAARNDAYDITEWLAAQPWSTGRIGMWGCSATGESQLQAASTRPPHLKAIFPMSCAFDAYPTFVAGGMAPLTGATATPPSETPAAARDRQAVPVDADVEREQLEAAIAEHADNIENAGRVPYRDSLASNVPGTRWWVQSNPQTYLSELRDSDVAMYIAANWDEGGSKYGAFFTFNNLKHKTKLIVGPAAHCAWFTVESQTGFDISVEELRFFDYWLKGVRNHIMDEPKVYYYTYNAPMGREWRASARWPLPNEQRTHYYLGAASLDAEAPSASAGKDEATVDYSVNASNLAEKGLAYATAPLVEDVEITGQPVVELWAASTATDGDFIATLQDVAPDGTATSYNVHGRLRASHRKEQTAPYDNLGLPWHSYKEADLQPLVPGEPVQLRFDLLPISMVVKAGHRIRVVLTFASDATPRLEPAPRVTIFRDAAHPSRLTLPIIPR